VSEIDWLSLADAPGSSQLRRLDSLAWPSPSSTQSYVFHAATGDGVGAAGVYRDGDYNPYASGGGCDFVTRRLSSAAGETGFSVFGFVNLTGTSITDVGYLFGIMAGSTPRFALRRGNVSGGIPESDVIQNAEPFILAVGSEPLDPDAWHHLQLWARVRDNGDVMLQVRRSLEVDTTSPIWEPVPGIPDLIDPNVATLTGLPPLIGGRLGFAFASDEVSRRAAVGEFRPRVQ
jgi:hypothetical protein